ncbi:hypothetical protein RHMOL_Rhmol12G0187100 [Rhododendron molle]|uniref:Uncharacterized protein n=1 Tax=Rhododendron molle TaxID=49168 RepID=A0ACC0LKV2_RHOML|nr:hypothetical protein RHMOL_Rhmol12G0187100 [Rhododendron molle]
MTIMEKIVIIPVDALLGFKSCGQSVSSVKGCRKRSLPGIGDGPKEKRQKMDKGHISTQSAKNECNMGGTDHKTSPLELTLLHKSLMSAGEKQKLREQVLEISKGNVPPCLRGLLKEIGVNCPNEEGRIELNMDAFAEEILLKLKRFVRFLGARAAKGDKEDCVELQQEKDRLEKQQCEKVRKDNKIRVATVASRKSAEAELKRQLEQERKAAQLALQQIEKTVEFDDNFDQFPTITTLEKIIIIPVDALLGFKSCGQSVSSIKGCRKRSLSGVGDGPKEKRQKHGPRLYFKSKCEE